VEHTVTFTLKTATVIREIQFYFIFRFGIVSSLEMFAGESRDLIVHITKGYTYITTEQPHASPFAERRFLTPIGNLSKTVVGTYIGQGIDVYIKVFNATLLIGIGVEGNGAVSPRALMWNAQNVDIGASGPITVKHTNPISSQETLTLRFFFKYSASLTVGSELWGGTVLEENVQDIKLNGDSVITELLSVVQPPKNELLIVGGAVTVVGIGTIAFIKLKRQARRRNKILREQERFRREMATEKT
jgi:hypothetical protein